MKTVNILLNGACGLMGKKIIEAAKDNPLVKIVAGVDRVDTIVDDVPVYSAIDKVTEAVDVVIDFSNPVALEGLLNYSENGKALIIATTGFSKEQEELIERKAKVFPIFKAANFSIGVYKFIEAVSSFAKDWEGDIEIVEFHHRKKVDAPSGTAKIIAEKIVKARGFGNIVYARAGRREVGEIGISAVRGGAISGIHKVYFLSDESEIEFSETETGKLSFAKGVLKAACFLVNKQAGKVYTMDDFLG